MVCSERFNAAARIGGGVALTQGKRDESRATNLIVAALLHREGSILMVEQQGPGDPFPSWALPGGAAAPGERLEAALKREVFEETGLEVIEIGDLQYLVEVAETAAGRRTLAFVFAVEGWRGQLQPADPDGLIIQARFVPPDEAIQLARTLPWRSMREPLIACLSGQAGPGTFWSYLTVPDGREGI
jgi:8-oxo-dGTP diphosphatase